MAHLLARAAAQWQDVDRDGFPNGVIVYLGEDVDQLLHCPSPLRKESFLCGETFDTAFVQEALQMRRSLTYGVIVLDGDEATWGIVQALPEGHPSSCSVTKLGHASANIASRTRRGGSSAARYSRNRDLEELAFLRKVGELAVRELGGVRGVLLGGRADLKRRLLPELPAPCRERVLAVVDLACGAGLDGLRTLASHVSEIAREGRQQELDAEVGRFLDLVDQTGLHEAPLICYGEAQTRAALRLGVVERLLVERSRGSTWQALAARGGASVTEVAATSALGLRFCEGFAVGALLRYAVDPAVLEVEEEEEGVQDTDDELCMADPSTGLARQKSPEVEGGSDDDDDSASTAASRTEESTALLRWLETALARALNDVIAAESLTACADVVLFDGDGSPDAERLETAVEMLRAEGVSEEVLVELVCHVTDLFETAH